jgi:hypothetical protein
MIVKPVQSGTGTLYRKNALPPSYASNCCQKLFLHEFHYAIGNRLTGNCNVSNFGLIQMTQIIILPECVLNRIPLPYRIP